MIPIRSIMIKDFSKLSSSESVGAAVKVMEKMDVDYLLVEEGEIRGIVTSRQLVGYPLSRLLLDCAIQPVSTITEGALADEALRVLEGGKTSFLVVLNAKGIPVGITNRETIIDSLFQELEKLNREKDKYIAELRQAEEALRLSKESFNNIVNRNVDGVLIIDRKGIVHFVNPAAEAIFGRKADELLGEMFGLPLVAGDASEIDTIRSSGELGVAEMRVIETEWDGENAYLASVRDITERRQAERELMIKDNAIASSINAIAIANFDGSLTYVNPAFLTMWGYDSDREVLGKSISEFWPTEEQAQAAIKTLYEKRSWQGELVETRKNGSEFYAQLSMSLVIDSDDRAIAIMTPFIDLTERKQAEESQERLSQQLQAQVSELETFSYGIAHDLRSPLVSIEGFSRLLRDDMLNHDAERVQEDIRLLESGVRKMQDFLNSTLEYSRSGQLIKRTKNVSFGKIVNEVITGFNGQISSIGATVSLADKFPRVYADRTRITQVLTNLIQNSIKYRDKTVPLKIEIGHRLSKGEVVFFVRDNGLGIDASEVEKLFDLFYRGTADGEGSGIGLAIVKKIIEAHGGRIWVQQGQSGKGTAMCFTLPKQRGINKGDNNGKD